MIFRDALPADIRQIQFVRNAVRENQLSDPSRITDTMVEEYILYRGKGWVCELNDSVIGFAIADLKDDNVWALFLLPEYEGRGIGRRLQEMMLGWYFQQGKESIWLSTTKNTRAEQFYRTSGWKETGIMENGEIRFEMTISGWKEINPGYSSE